MSERVVVIGLDMGDGDLIRAFTRQGHMPNFAALIEQGTWIDLESTARVLHTSTWPTFATGVLPGRHGVYYPYQPSPGHQEAQLIQPDQYGVPTLWKRADEQGRRCIVYDVPETFPEAEFGGQAIFEWGTWAWYGDRASQPADLLHELRRRFGVYPLKMEAKRLGARFPDPVELERRLLQSIEHKRASFEWLLGAQQWDLAITVFGETHPAGHYLWPRGAVGLSEGHDADFDAIRRVYVEIDRAVGSIRAALPSGVALAVLSGDGVTANHCGWHLVPEVLERLGFLARPVPQEGGGSAAKRLSLGTVKDMLPQGARRWIADRLPWWLRDKVGARMRSAQIDWSRTRAFALPTDLEGCIRINLEGREPQGIVAPGDYDALCRDIAAKLSELVNPATGASAVRQVWRRDDVFAGPSREYLPDIMVAWNNEAPIDALSSARIGTVEQESPDPRTGTHSWDGFCLAQGRRFARGISAVGRLQDVAPTILGLMNVEATGMDGRAWVSQPELADAMQRSG